MKFFADLHIHSRYSRATSKSLTISALAEGARRKGISLIGTGDFTHPAWLGEIEAGLDEAEPGLFKVRDGGQGARFMLTGEISTIYKQGDKVRKVHHLIAAPDLASARKISQSLARVGNILSDGRPILGITSRNLLEIVLDGSESAMLIPAHIWTPWFSVLGSKSGFDTIEECYGDLAQHIFAVETGLSSDPPMNWMVRSLDRYHLISNSDAHSAEKLGREATVFDCGLDYFAVRRALESGDGLMGTVEFFPEEGKYHQDGHRDCNVILTPEETRALGGICPVCGRKVTVGVLSRVEELADRHDGSRPPGARPFFSLIPLVEILGEIMQTGSASKKVGEAYAALLEKLGGELPLLLDVDADEIRAAAGETLALAITRMRKGEVHKEAGYDGVFGRIRVFRDNEEDMLFSGDLFGKPPARKKKAERKEAKSRDTKGKAASKKGNARGKLHPNPAQEEVTAFDEGHLIVRAGPGTGKTRALVERMGALLEKGEKSVLAVTFTTKAAEEIRQRLGREDIDVFTFHALAAKILRESGADFRIADEDTAAGLASLWGYDATGASIGDMLFRQSTKKTLEQGQASLLAKLKEHGYLTYEGMIEEAARLIEKGSFTPLWDHVMVDEFQDINPLQYGFMKLLAARARSVMAIGDPNQAIYGFRGSSQKSFEDFLADHSSVRSVALTQTYRLGAHIARASNAFIGREAVQSSRTGSPVRIVRTPESAAYIASEIEALAGGLSHRAVGKAKADYALSDIAVIVRSRQQAGPVMEALAKASIPFDAAYAKALSAAPGVSQRIALLEKQDWQVLVKGVGERAKEKLRRGGLDDPALSARIEKAADLLATTGGPIAGRIAALEGSGLFKLPELPKDHAFYRYACMFGGDAEGFVGYLRLSNDQGALAGEKVSVLTAHAAKGLEFKCVFMTGLSEGAFPMAGQDPAEEKNLFYVAMTRAVELLYLVCPPDAPSSFLDHVPQECCSLVEVKRKSRSGQMVLFE